MAVRPVGKTSETVLALIDAVKSVGPTTAGVLFNRIGAKPSPARLKELAKHAPVFSASFKKAPVAAAVFVGRPGEAQAALESEAIILAVLRLPAVKGNTTRAHTVAQLRDQLPTKYRADFEKVLRRRLTENHWPAAVGTIRVRGGKVLFLLEDVQGEASTAPFAAAVPRQASISGEPPGFRSNGRSIAELPAVDAEAMDVQSFVREFQAAFRDLVPRTRSGLVELVDMRAALSTYSPQQFERGLRHLREASDEYVLQSFDGRHGQLNPEALNAAIREGGRTYVYVKRREL